MMGFAPVSSESINQQAHDRPFSAASRKVLPAYRTSVTWPKVFPPTESGPPWVYLPEIVQV